MTIDITFKRPYRKSYNASRDEHGELKCPPIKRGDGCYGDCGDCYSIERDVYNRRKKALEAKK